MDDLDRIDWEILNATADDCEDLEQIYLAVCFELSGGPDNCVYRRMNTEVLLSDLADRVCKLVQRGLLAPMTDAGDAINDTNDQSYLWRAWFGMTPEGKKEWAASDHVNRVAPN